MVIFRREEERGGGVKKKGIKLPSKPKWSFKGGNSKPGLVVELLSLDPLIGKGIEKETMKPSAPSSCPEETLEARIVSDTLEQRHAESSSGLTMKEKELILVDLQPSPERSELGTVKPNPLKPGNVFSVLQNSDERDNELPLANATCDKVVAVSSNTLLATVITNRFSVLETIDEVVNEATSVEKKSMLKMRILKTLLHNMNLRVIL
ncbi:OLC1v1005296C1 [Oldenlandia corymbosa var. corymbosa]|uniref:OLC1v1005296C1 n=1 Tax=Oldenlandia corymbosa var. corymbosa TaxID=529605 RepID=A0AAV1DF20_OLDCO|nr:OLC1v1005296C1 [Oldenlandia corymbosa var. corymbosa]